LFWCFLKYLLPYPPVHPSGLSSYPQRETLADENHTYLSFITTSPAFIGVSPRVCNRHDSTEITDMDLVWVRGFKQSFSQELGCSVSNLAISFHFSKTKATITEKKERKKPQLWSSLAKCISSCWWNK